MNVLIIDDEQPAREELIRLLEMEADIRILGQCANAIEGISAINRLSPEVVFLDIQMPRISGLEMLSMLDPEKMPRIVFLTAFNEYALQAFEQDAFDYLLKPIDPARLEVTLKRLRRDRTPRPALFNAAAPPNKFYPGISACSWSRLMMSNLPRPRRPGSISPPQRVVNHFTELTLRTLEEKTPFLRCHRQYLINPEQIKEISFQEAGSAEIITRSDHRVPVSRRLLGELKEKLGFA